MKKNVLFPIFLAAAAVLTFYSCDGGSAPAPSNETKSTASENATASNTPNGETIFKSTCMACHQKNGEGIPNTFPPLAKSDFLANKENVITQVIKGKSGEIVVNGVKYNGTMPPQNISNEEIAAVLTYVYGNWGNSGEQVTAEEVKSIREKTQ